MRYRTYYLRLQYPYRDLHPQPNHPCLPAEHRAEGLQADPMLERPCPSQASDHDSAAQPDHLLLVAPRLLRLQCLRPPHRLVCLPQASRHQNPQSARLPGLVSSQAASPPCARPSHCRRSPVAVDLFPPSSRRRPHLPCCRLPRTCHRLLLGREDPLGQFGHMGPLPLHPLARLPSCRHSHLPRLTAHPPCGHQSRRSYRQHHLCLSCPARALHSHHLPHPAGLPPALRLRSRC